MRTCQELHGDGCDAKVGMKLNVTGCRCPFILLYCGTTAFTDGATLTLSTTTIFIPESVG